MRYVRSLDGLRAIAILLVMSVHYHQKFGGGWLGVQLFFVISGFLITGILVQAKKDSASLPKYLGNFYARRTFRIFPLYFAFAALIALSASYLGMPPNWSQVSPWLLTYTLNFAHMFNLVPVDDMYSHFWSLAVEEQFYLIWPFVIWLTPTARLPWVVMGCAVLAPTLRALMIAGGADTAQLYFFTPCQMDAFAAGAAISILSVRPKYPLSSLIAVGSLAVLLGIAVNWSYNWKFAIASAGHPYYMPHGWQYIWGYSLINIAAALTLSACLQGRLEWLGAPVLVGIGRISYGIYVFHRPVIGMLDRYLAPMLSTRLAALVEPVLYVGISYGLAWLSYKYFERPCLHLRDRLFPDRSVTPPISKPAYP